MPDLPSFSRTDPRGMQAPSAGRRSLLLGGVSALALGTMASGCGGAIGDLFNRASARFVNGTAHRTSIDGHVERVRVAQALANFGQVSSYGEVMTGDLRVSASNAGSSSSFVSQDHDLRRDRHYTAIAYGSEASGPRLRVITEDHDAAAVDRTLVRAMHFAPDAGALHVYLTADDADLTQTTPTLQLTAFENETGFLTLESGTYRLRITPAGDPTTPRYDFVGLNLLTRAVLTLAVVPRTGSLLSVSALPEQEAGAMLPNRLA